ncbi:MAG: hypothetical protein SH850_22135 [Planctomycetaceae bacterium]|nr:hypothetical protein [Planctomycetaceae bacterium]
MANAKDKYPGLIPAAFLVGLIVAIPASLLVTLAAYSATSNPAYAARMALGSGLVLLSGVSLWAWYAMLLEFNSERHQNRLDFDNDHRY